MIRCENVEQEERSGEEGIEEIYVWDFVRTISEVVDRESAVESLLRTRYTLNEELALNRQRETKPEEFGTFYQFVELCKEKATEEFGY